MSVWNHRPVGLGGVGDNYPDSIGGKLYLLVGQMSAIGWALFVFFESSATPVISLLGALFAYFILGQTFFIMVAPIMTAFMVIIAFIFWFLT